MPGVEPVLEVDLGLADEVVGAQQVPVDDLNSQDRVLRKRGLELETPEMSDVIGPRVSKHKCCYH